MKYALFSVPVGTIYDLPQTIKEGEEGLVSTIGDEGLYGQACQVRTAPGGVTAAGVRLPPDVAEVVSFSISMVTLLIAVLAAASAPRRLATFAHLKAL